MFISGITCARIARVSLPSVLYACRGGTHCFFGVDFPLVSGVLLAGLHLLRARTRLDLLKILALVVFLLLIGKSLIIPGLLPKLLLIASRNLGRKFMIFVRNIAGERGEAGVQLVISRKGTIVCSTLRETVLALVFGHKDGLL